MLGKVEVRAKNITISGIVWARGSIGIKGGDATGNQPSKGGVGGLGGNGGGGGGSGRGENFLEDKTEDGGLAGFGIINNGADGGQAPVGTSDKGGGKGGLGGTQASPHQLHYGFAVGASDEFSYGGGGDGGAGDSYASPAYGSVNPKPRAGGSGGGGGGGGMYLRLVAQENISFNVTGQIDASGGKGGDGGEPDRGPGFPDGYGQAGQGGGGGTVILETKSSTGGISGITGQVAVKVNGGDGGKGGYGAAGGEAGLFRAMSVKVTLVAETKNGSGTEPVLFGSGDPRAVKSPQILTAKIVKEFPDAPSFVNTDIPFKLSMNFLDDTRLGNKTVKIDIPQGLEVPEKAAGFELKDYKLSYVGVPPGGGTFPFKFKVTKDLYEKLPSNSPKKLKITAQIFDSGGNLLHEIFDESLLINRIISSDIYSKAGVDALQNAASSISGVIAGEALMTPPAAAIQAQGATLPGYKLSDDINSKFDAKDWGNSEIRQRVNRLITEFAKKSPTLYQTSTSCSYGAETVVRDITTLFCPVLHGSFSSVLPTTIILTTTDQMNINTNILNAVAPTAIVAQGNIVVDPNLVRTLQGIFYTTGKFTWKRGSPYDGVFKGVIIALGGIELGSGVTTIEYDPDILSNPPPGFGGLFIPVWQE